MNQSLDVKLHFLKLFDFSHLKTINEISDETTLSNKITAIETLFNAFHN